MAKGSPKVLASTEAEVKAAAEAAQRLAREANSASLNDSVRAVIAELYAADTAIKTAQAAVETAQSFAATKLESAYVALANLAHVNELDIPQCRDMLTAAIESFYGKGSCDMAVSTEGKLRSQLLRAMNPKVRAQLPAIMRPWQLAWEAETAAKAADPEAETPLRDKFTGRGNLVNSALVLALGKEPNTKGKGGKPSVVAADPAAVLTWVAANPKGTRTVKTPDGTTPSTEAAKAAVSAGAGLSPMQAASAKVDALIAAVKAVSTEYNDPDCFVAVLAALANCTAAKLVPASQAASGTETAAKAAADKAAAVATKAAEVAAAKAAADAKAAEPVAGAADLDSAVADEFKLFQQFLAMRNGK